MLSISLHYLPMKCLQKQAGEGRIADAKCYVCRVAEKVYRLDNEKENIRRGYDEVRQDVRVFG